MECFTAILMFEKLLNSGATRSLGWKVPTNLMGSSGRYFNWGIFFFISPSLVLRQGSAQAPFFFSCATAPEAVWILTKQIIQLLQSTSCLSNDVFINVPSNTTWLAALSHCFSKKFGPSRNITVCNCEVHFWGRFFEKPTTNWWPNSHMHCLELHGMCDRSYNLKPSLEALSYQSTPIWFLDRKSSTTTQLYNFPFGLEFRDERWLFILTTLIHLFVCYFTEQFNGYV